MRQLLLLVTAGATLATPLFAQPVRRLSSPAAVFDEPLSSISGVRELRDGRVIVSDARDRSLQLIDFRDGSATGIGREGSGPGEWRVPSRLHAMPGDSTLMEDFANGRYFVIGPDGKPAATFQLAAGSPAAFGTLLGVDTRGRLIIERPLLAEREGPGVGSTGVSFVLRYDRSSARVDTVGRLSKVAGEFSGVSQLPGGMLRAFTNRPLAALDLAGAATDGRVVILRHSPYRLEWVSATDVRGEGPAAEGPRVRVTQAEKEAFARGQVRPGTIVVRDGAAGGSGGAVARPSAADIDAAAMASLTNPDMTWPDWKPPFLSGALFAAPEGRMWVLRTRAHDDRVPVFDVFDASGRVVERVALPAGTRIAGFGRHAVYVVRTDEDDLQYLERYALPR